MMIQSWISYCLLFTTSSMFTCLVQSFMTRCKWSVRLPNQNWPWPLLHIVVYHLPHGCCVLFWFWQLLPYWLGHIIHFLSPLPPNFSVVLEMLQYPLLDSLTPLRVIPVSCCQSGMVLIHLSYYLLYTLYWPVYPLLLTPSGIYVSLFYFYAPFVLVILHQ